jgi:hypothetical protein
MSWMRGQTGSCEAAVAVSSAQLLENPFPGLRPYRESESANFFGQDEQIDRLLDRLGDSRFLAVVGMSGSGKSSLVRAGVIAALTAGSDAADPRWRVVTCRPGADPVLNLAAALEKALGFENSQALAYVRRSARGIVDAVNAAALDSDRRVLLLVDQFEELFRYRRADASLKREDEAAHFVRLLLEAASDETTNIYIILTMRSDFLGDCALFYGLAERINAGLYLVPKMQRRNLREVIVEPLRQRGVEIEPAFVERLLNESEEREDGLPLLQHALMRMWRRWAKRGAPDSTIRERDFRLWRTPSSTRPTIELHLDRHLGSIYRCLSASRRSCAESLFKLLSERDSKGREVRRGVRFDELCRILRVDGPELLGVIDAFRDEAAGRTFLMPPKNESSSSDPIDLSHECLLRQWTMLKLWIREEAYNAGQFQQLADRAASGGNLLARKDLQLFSGWWNTFSPTPEWAGRYERPADPSLGIWSRSYEQAVAYLNASQAAQRQEDEREESERRAKEAMALAAANYRRNMKRLVAAVVVVLGIAGAALWQRSIAEHASIIEAQARAAAAEATAEAARTTQTVVAAERRKEIEPKIDSGGSRSPASAEIRPRLYTQCWTLEQWQKRVAPFKAKLQDGGFTIPAWEKVSVGPQVDEVRYFHGDDAERARQIQTILGNGLPVKLSYVRGFENSTSIRPGHFELWLANPQQGVAK